MSILELQESNWKTDFGNWIPLNKKRCFKARSHLRRQMCKVDVRNSKLEEQNTNSAEWPSKQLPRKSVAHAIIKLDFGGHSFFWRSDHPRSTFKMQLPTFDFWVLVFERWSFETRFVKSDLWSSIREVRFMNLTVKINCSISMFNSAMFYNLTL